MGCPPNSAYRQNMKAPSKVAVSLVIVVACLVLPVYSPLAQEAQPSPAPAHSVKLTLIVTDSANHAVDDIRQEQIQLVAEKLPQALSSLSRDVRFTDYALVLDNSGSFRSLLPPVILAAKALINDNRPEDETFIESFISNANIEKVQEFTADKSKLNAALDSLYVRFGPTAVIDAVYLAVKHTAEYKGGSAERRRAVVLFTDGEDRASYYRTDQLVELLREKDVQVFIVGIVNLLDKNAGLIRKSPREKAERLLKKIAEESGGRIFFPRDGKEFSEAMAQISHDLHFQYLLEFGRQGKAGEKGFRKLKITVADAAGTELTVITRPGYLINAPGQKSVEKKTP
jgi:Ca-activated chloride channel family protein